MDIHQYIRSDGGDTYSTGDFILVHASNHFPTGAWQVVGRNLSEHDI